MAQYLFDHGHAYSLGSISTEEDLKGAPRRGVSINPPPKDGRCDCCKRHIRDLPPFGKAGDPLVGDFSGMKLVKVWRRDFPKDAEAEAIYARFFTDSDTEEEHQNAWARLVQQYGEAKANNIRGAVHAAGQIGSAWLCRECVVLDEAQYFARRWNTVTTEPA